MSKIVISATLDFATQEKRDEAVRLTTPVQLRTRNEEAGCHAYCFAADPAVPTRIQVYELWEDPASIAAHFTHPYYEEMKKILGSIGLVGTENQIYYAAKHAPVYVGDGVPNHAFLNSCGD